MNVRFLVIRLLFAAVVANAAAPRGYYRFPTIHHDTVVFTAEGDLWRVGIGGGVAQRITTHPGTESHAAISPDGMTVAFTAEYEGPQEVYTMPLAGGLPTRRTFEGGRALVAGWAPDGKVLYATEWYSTLPNWQLATLDMQTGQKAVLPLAQASQGAFAPGGALVFTRLNKQGSSTKRYQGGWVENLWKFSEGQSEAAPLTGDFKGTSRHPMWWQDRVYFVSDRDGIMNLWSMKPEGGNVRQLTRHKDFDVKTPALHEGRIVYQHGADLRLLDIAKGADTVLDIQLSTDFDQQRERWVKKPMDYLTAAHISPNGDRLVLTARGQVFVAPVEQGRFVEVPRKPDVRYRNARFLPDGKTLITLSDETGEAEFWRLSANGLGPARPVTTNGNRFRFEGVPSPDGRHLAWSDKDRKFWIHDFDKETARLVEDSPRDLIDDFAWSPDSRWLAYVSPASNHVRQVHLFHLPDGVRTTVTTERVESFSPAWAPDGKWLYFLSDRDLKTLVSSPWGPRQPEPFFTESTKIYAFALKRDQRWPFAPGDELQPDKPDTKNGDKEKQDDGPDAAKGAETTKSPAGKAGAEAKADSPKPPPVEIEFEGLAERLFEVPVAAGNYQNLEVTSQHLLWVARDTGFKGASHLKQLEITRKDPKPKTLVEDVERVELTADRKKLLIRKGESFHVIAASASAPAKLEDRVDLSRWTFSVTPREEWRQIYREAWRMMRDYFYDRAMHKVDWPGMRDKYAPLVDRVSDRAELSDVLAEMVGELSTLHIAVRFGDVREAPDQVRTASLGARLVRDEPAGGWRVERVFRADPDYPASLAPLARPEVRIGEGEVITRINGRETLSVAHPEMLLRNQAGQQVLIEVKPRDGGSAREVIVRPITADQESALRYDDWELERRERVEQLGGGRIGYVHLRAMGPQDIAQWARDYFPVFNRQGLIIDVRSNRGGNIDAWILNRLLRKAWFYWQPPVGEPYWNMHYAFRGHITVLCNEKTASDGEAFSEGFKRLGLGKVIGTRTWGGEVWLSAQRWLVDSGMATAAEIGVYGPEGAWLVEGHGVDPDIVVDNLPHATFKGRDAQLEAAVKHLQGLIAKDPRPVPPAPRYPDKSFKPRN